MSRTTALTTILLIMVFYYTPVNAGMSSAGERFRLFAQLSLEEATSKVKEKVEGRILGAKTEKVKGKTIYIIKVLTPEGRVRHYRVDAEDNSSSEQAQPLK